MGYEKPKCECGAELVFWRQDIVDVETPITKDGKSSKLGVKKYPGGTEYHTRLVCKECDAQYEDRYDKEGRVYRGFKFDGLD